MHPAPPFVIEPVAPALREASLADDTYRSLLDAADEGFCLLAASEGAAAPGDFRILEANAAFVEQTGLRDPVGKTGAALDPSREAHAFQVLAGIALGAPAQRLELPAPALGRQLQVYGFRTGSLPARTVALLVKDVTDEKRDEALRAALGRVAEAVHSSLELDEVCRRLVREGALALGCETAALSERVAGGWRVTSVHGMPAAIVGCTMTDREERHAVLAARTRMPVAVEDAASDERVDREHLRKHGVRSVLVAPLPDREEPAGALFFNYHSAPHAFSPAEVRFAQDLAASASTALQNALLFAKRREVEEALREADRRKTRFLAVLSHELRNPLAPLRNAVFVLDHAAPGDDAVRRAQAVLHRQTEHLSRLVDDLLDVARIGSGKIELRPTRLDAREIVRRACEDLHGAFEQRGVALLKAVGEPVWIEADGARLAQMIGNLLRNALKFTPPGGRVEVSLQAHGGVCAITVRDTGLGIAPEDLADLFTPFAQAERTRPHAQDGLGIGLSLVRELARLHGGTARASSPGVGKGAEFVIELPIAPTATPKAAAIPVTSTAPGLSVLVVEDNEDAGATLGDLLTLLGHSVRVVRTGREALEAIGLAHPDVLLCDIGLPDTTGHDLIRSVRATGGGRPFAIALTGYAQPHDREDALRAGFDAHLAKPAGMDELLLLLERAAARQR